MNVDQIVDKKTVAIPGPIGQVTPSLQQLHDETETYAANTKTLQDQAVSSLLLDASSATWSAQQTITDKWRGIIANVRDSSWWTVCFGDSYMRGYLDGGGAGNENPQFAPGALFANAMGTSYKNYAVSGSSFVTGNIQSQLNVAKGDTGIDPTRVKWVIFGGGRNDNGADVALSTLNGFLDGILSTYVNATVIWAYGMWDAGLGSEVVTMRMWRNFGLGQQVYNHNGKVIICQQPWRWLALDYGSCNSNHPNEKGYNKLAQHFISAAMGNSYAGAVFDLTSYFTPKYAEASPNDITLRAENGYVSVCGSLHYLEKDLFDGTDTHLTRYLADVPVMNRGTYRGFAGWLSGPQHPRNASLAVVYGSTGLGQLKYYLQDEQPVAADNGHQLDIMMFGTYDAFPLD